MEQFNELGRVGDGVRDLSVDLALAADAFAPDFLEKAVHAFDPVGIPRLHGVERSEEHQIETQGIRAVRLDDRVGAHDIAAALGHFFAVFAENDSLVEQLGEWLALRHDAEVEQHLVPESRVQEVEHRMFGTADVKVGHAPVAERLR